MDDTVAYYEDAEELARDLQQHEHAAALHDEFQWHVVGENRSRSILSGAGSLAQRFDLVLPPVKSLIAIGIVIGLLTVGAFAASVYEIKATAAEAPMYEAKTTVTEAPKLDDSFVGFKSISDQRRIEYQLRLGVDSSKASVDAFVVQTDSPERHPVTGSQCTRDTSGLNQTHQCMAALDSALPAGKYTLEIDVSHSGQHQETIRTKRFTLQ